MQELKHTKTEGFEFDYIIDTPENYKPNEESLPLVVYLHGIGTRTDDPQVMKDGLFVNVFREKAKARCVGLFPHCKDGVWNGKTYELKQLIDFIADEYNIDMQRISITGASMGGFGTWAMIISFPCFFSCAVPVCGGADRFLASEITHMPIWAFHGDKDPTVDFAFSRSMIDALNALGNKEAKLTVCENVYHDSWVNAYEKSDCINWMLSQERHVYEVYVAANHDEGGVFRFRLDTKTGEMRFTERVICPGPMWLEKKKSTLYAVMRKPCEDGNGGIQKFDITDGRLKDKSPIYTAMGKATCHLCVDDSENVFVANYTTANIVKYSNGMKNCDTVLHEKRSINDKRQEKAHVHQVVETPDKKYIISCDLGEDNIYIYDKNLCEISVTAAIPGTGPRHIVFSHDGKTAFCINELSSSVTVYDYDDGKLTLLADYAMLDEYDEKSTAAAIRLSNDGKYLYTSVRSADKIVVFEVNGKALNRIAVTDCGGNRPRDINLSPDGKYLVCANEGNKGEEENGKTVLFRIGENRLPEKTSFEYKTPDALAVLFV